MTDPIRSEWLELTFPSTAGGRAYRLVEVTYVPVEADCGSVRAYRVLCQGIELGQVESTTYLFGALVWRVRTAHGTGDYTHPRRRDAVAELCGAYGVLYVKRDAVDHYRTRACYVPREEVTLDRLLVGA